MAFLVPVHEEDILVHLQNDLNNIAEIGEILIYNWNTYGVLDPKKRGSWPWPQPDTWGMITRGRYSPEVVKELQKVRRDKKREAERANKVKKAVEPKEEIETPDEPKPQKPLRFKIPKKREPKSPKEKRLNKRSRGVKIGRKRGRGGSPTVTPKYKPRLIFEESRRKRNAKRAERADKADKAR